MSARSATDQKKDAERLLASARELADKMLREHGELLRPDGSLASVGVQTDSDDSSSPQELIESLKAYYRDQAVAGSLVASAIVSDVRIKPPSAETKQDAVSVSLRHRDGYCVDVFFPYSLSETGLVHFDPPFAQKG